MRLIIRIYAPLPSTGLLEDSRRLEKERVALRGALAERGSASLVGHLDRPERRQISVHEYGLRVLAIDSRVGLKEHPQEQIFREELVSSKYVNPRPFLFRIRVEHQALERILGRECGRDLVARGCGP